MSNKPVPTTSLDDVDSISTRPGIGRHRGKLLQCTGELSASKNPMLVPIYVITEGEAEGGETRQYLTLFKKKSKKNGKTYAFGPMEISRIFTLVGKPLPKGFNFPMIDADADVDEDTKQAVADAAASLFAKRVNGLDLEIVISDDGESDKIDETTGKPYRRTRTSIAGLFKKAQAPSSADVVDPYDEDE